MNYNPPTSLRFRVGSEVRAALAGATYGVDVVVTGTDLGVSASCELTDGVMAWFPLLVRIAVPHAEYALTLPPWQGSGLSLACTVAGQASNALPLSYAPPEFSYEVVAGDRGTPGGASLVITGSNLGELTHSNATRDLSWLTLGGARCNCSSWSQTRAACVVPEGQGALLPLVVTAGNQASRASADRQFSYDPPVIEAPRGGRWLANTSALEGDGSPSTLELRGRNFGVFGSIVIQVRARCVPECHVVRADLNGPGPRGLRVVDGRGLDRRGAGVRPFPRAAPPPRGRGLRVPRARERLRAALGAGLRVLVPPAVGGRRVAGVDADGLVLPVGAADAGKPGQRPGHAHPSAQVLPAGTSAAGGVQLRRALRGRHPQRRDGAEHVPRRPRLPRRLRGPLLPLHAPV